jgi:alkanesulfonate monooxygenase SsuD/methylene tetrahydromethanopterin reductase-like flavin-dependent oxidoreductase (luciferase family)
VTSLRPLTTIRPQARHKGELTIDMKVAGSSPTSARLAAEHGLGQMFVADDNLEQMATKIARFNGIRSELGLPPTSRPRCVWMYCGGDRRGGG